MAVDSSDPKKEQLGRFREHRDERKEYKGVNIAVVWKNISVQPVRLLRDSQRPLGAPTFRLLRQAGSVKDSARNNAKKLG